MTSQTDPIGRRLAALAIVLSVVAGLFAGRTLLSGLDGSPAGPSVLGSGDPAAESAPGASGPAAPAIAGPIVAVPAGVDPTGGEDVTQALQAALDRAPDGATIRFPDGARYQLAGTLHLDGRHDLVLDGRGASFQAASADGAARPLIAISGSSRVTIRDLILIGANQQPGVYQPAREHDHGISIVGGTTISLARLTVERTSGDCVYVADRGGAWSDGVSLLDSTCRGPGRNGVAVVGGRNIDIERTAFSNVGYHVLDLEPNQGPPLEGASNVTFRANTVSGPVAGYVIAANGWGPVDHLTVSDNLLNGLTLRVTVAPLTGSGFRRRVVAITANRSDTSADQAEPLMQFDSTDDLTITGNSQPLADAAVFAGITNSCRVTVSGNELGSGQPALISGPSC
jgi:hypothetical protein